MFNNTNDIKNLLNYAYNKTKKIGSVKEVKNIKKIDLNDDKNIQPQIKKEGILDKLKDIIEDAYFQQAEKINKSGKPVKFAGYIFKNKNGNTYVVNNLDKIALELKEGEDINIKSLDEFINLVKYYENKNINNNIVNKKIYEKFKNMKKEDVIRYILENYQNEINNFANQKNIPKEELKTIKKYMLYNSEIKGYIDNKNNPRVISFLDEILNKRIDLIFDKNLKLKATVAVNYLPDNEDADLKALYNLFNGEGLKQEGLFTDIIDDLSPTIFIHSLLVGKYAIENNIDDISKINKDKYIEQLNEKFPYISDDNDKILNKLKKELNNTLILDKEFSRALFYNNDRIYYMLFLKNFKGQGYQSFNISNIKKYNLYKILENNYSKFKMVTTLYQKKNEDDVSIFEEPSRKIC